MFKSSQIQNCKKNSASITFESGTDPYKNGYDGTYSTKMCPPTRSKSDTTLSENMYENLKHFTSAKDTGQDKNYYCPENIYENICHNCGRIYDEVCGFCNDEPFECLDETVSINKNGNNRWFFRKLFKRHFKSQSLKRSNSKIKKNEIYIVRDTNDEDTVFKTNCTFDIREMSRMRNNFLLNAGYESNDKMQNGENKEVVYENLSFYEAIDASVNCWIKSVSKYTEDYDNQTPYNVKAIPSKTFNESEWSLGITIDHKEKQIDTHNALELNENVARFMHSYRETISKDHINTEKPKRVKIFWSNGSSDDRLQSGLNQRYKIGGGNLFEILNKPLKRQKSIVTPLEHNLIDNECNLPTTIIQSRHQANDSFLSIISKTNNIDDNFHVRPQQAYMYLNKLLLSISLNTITLSYDKYLKKISFYYRLKIKRKSTDYFCSLEANTLLNWNNSDFVIEPLFEKPKCAQKKINSTSLHHQQLPENIFLSKNESLNALPSTHHQNTQSYSSLRKNYKFSRAITNMDSKTKTEVNNNIYYFIWNCDSTSENTLARYHESPQKHSSSIIQDDEYWVSAQEDFTSAGDLMDVVDESPRLFMVKDRKEKKYHDIRTYSDVLILYNKDPLNNKIIYDQPKVSTLVRNPNTPNVKENRSKSNENLFILNSNGKKKALDLSLLQDSVKEFIMTIRDNEDEDELVRFL